MDKVKNLIEAVFAIGIVIYFLLWYSGKLNLKGKKEEKRQERLKGDMAPWKVLFVSSAVLILSIVLIYLTFSE